MAAVPHQRPPLRRIPHPVRIFPRFHRPRALPNSVVFDRAIHTSAPYFSKRRAHSPRPIARSPSARHRYALLIPSIRLCPNTRPRRAAWARPEPRSRVLECHQATGNPRARTYVARVATKFSCYFPFKRRLENGRPHDGFWSMSDHVFKRCENAFSHQRSLRRPQGVTQRNSSVLARDSTGRCRASEGPRPRAGGRAPASVRSWSRCP